MIYENFQKKRLNAFDNSNPCLYYGLTLSFRMKYLENGGTSFLGASHMNPCVGYHLTRVRQLTSSAVDGSFIHNELMNFHNKGPVFIYYRGLCLCFDPLLAELCPDPLFGGLFVLS